jgi:hypothetical protein
MIALIVLLMMMPAQAAPVRNVGPWFISTEEGGAGVAVAVGQTGAELGFMARCYGGGESLVVWGVQHRLGLQKARQVKLRLLVDGKDAFLLTGIATQANRAEFIVDAPAAIARMRRGQQMVMALTDLGDETAAQSFVLVYAAPAFAQYGAGCP